MFIPRSRTDRRLAAAIVAMVWGLGLGATPSMAQREIVQPLPRAEAGDLNSALRRLSRNPSDLDALVAAGEASAALNDFDAAEGFFARALAVAPANGAALMGMARVHLDDGKPIEALDYFARAEAAGISPAAMAGARGFAYDLVGDPARAQAHYRQALAARDEPEVRRRLAVSLAISGQRQAFEDAIYPLLSANDRSAFRARAFGLAILGEQEEAVVIAETMLPTDLALRLAPYLRYMPRLTAAQQSAAANLGVFPRASEIGRDDAAIAAYAAQGQRIARNADSALTPSGQALGQQPNSSTAAPRQAEAENRRRSRPDRRVSPMAATRGNTRDERPAKSPTTNANPAPANSPPASIPAEAAPAVAQPVVVASAAEQPPRIATIEVPASEPAREQQRVDLADAFADFGSVPASTAARMADAVDITSIEPPREKEQAEPPKPVHPARHWVQVATGRDLAALKFDWRRIARTAGAGLGEKGPFVAPWGQANRLLAGPYESAKAAREKVNELKELGVDSFPFASAEGEKVTPLD